MNNQIYHKKLKFDLQSVHAVKLMIMTEVKEILDTDDKMVYFTDFQFKQLRQVFMSDLDQ